MTSHAITSISDVEIGMRVKHATRGLGRVVDFKRKEFKIKGPVLPFE